MRCTLLADPCQIMPATALAYCVHKCCVECHACGIVEQLVFVQMVLCVVHTFLQKVDANSSGLTLPIQGGNVEQH